MKQTNTLPIKIHDSSIDELRLICREQGRQLFAILDACDEPLVPEKVGELGRAKAVSLYNGVAYQNYWAISPYLVIVDENMLDWIVDNLWSDPWGIFAVADATLNEVRKHFRRFLMIDGPDGTQWYFRFYDPRVLEDFLAVSSTDQKQMIFAGVSEYLIANGTGQIRSLQI